MKMKAPCFGGTRGNTNPMTQCHIPEDLDTQQQCCGNLRSHVLYPVSQFWQLILLSCSYSRCLSYLRSIINCHLLCVQFFVLDVLSSGSCHILQHSFSLFFLITASSKKLVPYKALFSNLSSLFVFSEVAQLT